jgi:hypothetical protein
MLLVENQALATYSAGTIQMVPGRNGYEPATHEDETGERLLARTSREALYRRPGRLDTTYETTYSENRRLSSPGTSNIGNFIDIYA